MSAASDALRDASRAFVLAISAAAMGFQRGDLAFDEVTQDRQRKGYSSCGDLWALVLWHLGADGRYVNRTTVETRWEDRRNINKPWKHANDAKTWRKSGKTPPPPAALVLIGQYPHEAEHALIFREQIGEAPAPRRWKTDNFGQVRPKTFVPCSAAVLRSADDFQVSGRTIIGWIDVADVAITRPATLPAFCADNAECLAALADLERARAAFANENTGKASA
jgi:hypothetical protein